MEEKEKRLNDARKKQYIEDVNRTVDFVLDGLSMEEIAKKEQKTNNTIYKRINALNDVQSSVYNPETYQKVMNVLIGIKNEKKEKEREMLTQNILSLYRKGFTLTEAKKRSGSHKLATEIYEGLISENSPYYEPETYQNIEKVKQEKLEEVRNNLTISSPKVENSVFEKFSFYTRKEIVLMALTFRLSFKTLAQMFGTTIEDVATLYIGNSELKSAMIWLDKETINESPSFTILAYRKAKKYWDERKLLRKAIRSLEENDDIDKEKYRKMLKELHQEIDDTNIALISKKETNDLTQEERDALARYCLKYGFSIHSASVILKRQMNTIQQMEESLAERDPIYKVKIEKLNDYHYNHIYSRYHYNNFQEETSKFGRRGGF